MKPTGQFQVALDWWYLFDNDATAPIRALYGINGQFEVGALFMTSEDEDMDMIGANAKYVLPFTAGDAAWAVGAEFLDPDDGDSSLVAYLATTKAFTETFSGTAALVWSENGTFFEDNDFSLAIGGEATFDSGLKLVGEYVNFLPGAELNMAMRYPFTPALTGQIGYTFDTQAPFIGAMYAFGGAE